MRRFRSALWTHWLPLLALLAWGKPAAAVGELHLMNVSYDTAREFYADYNVAFSKHYLKETGRGVDVRQSHGGSQTQVQRVIQGLEADVVTLTSAGEIDQIAGKVDWIAADWQKRLPDNSAPYTSTMVFLVRQGNPKNIRDWEDLLRPDVSVILASPKKSGGARWNYLAAWGAAVRRHLETLEQQGQPIGAAELAEAQEKGRQFVAALYTHADVQDAGARATTSVFTWRDRGDVLVTWESESLQMLRQFKSKHYEIVTPSISILAEPAVAIVDKVVDKHGTRTLAEAYLQYLYSPEGQELAARHFYRPRLPEAAAKAGLEFPKLKLFTVDELFGGWKQAEALHFANVGIYDQIRAAAPPAPPGQAK